jgi:hypothetical protein
MKSGCLKAVILSPISDHLPLCKRRAECARGRNDHRCLFALDVKFRIPTCGSTATRQKAARDQRVLHTTTEIVGVGRGDNSNS